VSNEEKRTVSHRGQAFRTLVTWLRTTGRSRST
jgi:inosine/xanthosine triphosphate pyrophosphatase family protein